MTEELFNFADTSDVPDWAVQKVLDAIGWVDQTPRQTREYIWNGMGGDKAAIGFARLISRHYPELMPEDPDLAIVRELWAQDLEEEAFADDVRSGNCDNWPVFAIRLAMFKAGREAERAGK